MRDNSKKKASIIIGSLFILIGITFNEWVLTALFSPDGIIETKTRIIIWSFTLLFVFTGLSTIKYNLFKMTPREIVFCLVIFIFFLFALEGGFRIYYFLIDKLDYPEKTFSLYLGWETAANYHRNNHYMGYGKITYSTTKYGFRLFGDVNTRKKKIFVIGDSSTQAETVSNGNTYYDYLYHKNNNIEIFAYGCGGYGSLQEYMILDKYIELIKPDMILWQFCSNDIVNNDHELESASFINNNHMTRPYFKDGRIEWLYPKQSSGWIYSVIQASYLLRMLNIRLNILMAERKGSIENKLSPDDAMFRKAFEATSEIMSLVRKRAKDIPIVAFSIDNPGWVGNSFSDICDYHDIYYISGIPEAIENAKKAGLVVDATPYDVHYNNVGHAIIGKLVLKYMQEKKLLSDEKS